MRSIVIIHGSSRVVTATAARGPDVTETSKTGLPTWLMWVLGIVFLPIGIVWGLVVMWRRGNFNAAVRVGLTVAGAVALFFVSAIGVGMVQGAATYDSSAPAAASAPETKKPAPVSKPAPKPAAAPSLAHGVVTEAAVKAAITPALASGAAITKVEVRDNLGTDAPDDKIIHINYEPGGGAGLAPRPMLMDLAKTSGGMFKALFANPDVTAADVTADVVMVAAGGGESKTAGARIYWDRKKADSVVWAKYESDVMNGYYWDAFTGAPDFYVHPGVLAGLNDQDRAKLQK